MELPINIVIIVLVAMVVLMIVLGLAMLIKEKGVDIVSDIWNIDKWVKIITGG